MTTEPAAAGTQRRLGCVTVTYHPDARSLQAQLAALPVDAVKLVVDNASGTACVAMLRELEAQIPGMRVVCNAANAGLAAALDQGVRALASLDPPCTDVLLLDQDSEPQAGSIERLQHALQQLTAAGAKPGAVGPQLLDPDTGMMHGFHCMTRWRWRRVHAGPDDAPLQVANLNGSGTLMRIDDYLALGGLDTTLFIDHVDTEWSFRMLSRGYTLWGVPDAVFRHRMGERGLRIWMFGWRVWPARSPLRHRYLFRNTLVLMRRAYVPRVWKFWAGVKLAITLAIFACVDPQRGAQISSMWRGSCEGLGGPSWQSQD